MRIFLIEENYKLIRKIGDYMAKIHKIRMMNFKSVVNETIVFADENVFFGKNNSGKSNIIKAIKLALSRKVYGTEHDIRNFQIGVNEICIVDIQLVGEVDGTFSEDWVFLFGEDYVIEDDGLEVYNIRCKVFFDPETNRINTKRFSFIEWQNVDIDEEEGRRIPYQFYDSFVVFYNEASRDISEEIRKRRTNFSNMINSVGSDISEEIRTSIEDGLDEINREILQNLPLLEEIGDSLSDINTTLNSNNTVNLLPIPNKLDDLQKGFEIFIENDYSMLPVSEYGDGTRSWMSVLGLLKYIDVLEKINISCNLPFKGILLLEEPEAHLHGHAQKRIFQQVKRSKSQKIITSHSGILLSECDLESIVKVSCKKGITKCVRMNDLGLDSLSLMKLKSQILDTRAEIMFADIVLLCEGISDKALLQSSYKSQKGVSLSEDGISIIAVGGWKSFVPFIRFVQMLEVEVIVLADLDCKKSLEKNLRNNSLDEVKRVYTKYKDIETDVIHEYFDVILEFYKNEKELNDSELTELASSVDINEVVYCYIAHKKNKTRYPYFLSKLLEDGELPILTSIYNTLHMIEEN